MKKTPPRPARNSPAYIQTKIRACQKPGYRGLEKLAMWYGFCAADHYANWETQWREAALADGAGDKAILVVQPGGYTFRRILTDGRLLMVYNDDGSLAEDSLLPINILGANGFVMEIEDVPGYVLEHGGFRARFAIAGLTYTGYILPGSQFWGAWDEENQRGRFFESSQGKNPAAKILEKL